jgi:diacylglycerol kinase (ATP)
VQRIINAFFNSCAGFVSAYRSEAAIRQEIFLLFAALPLAFMIAKGVWQYVVMIGSLLLLIAIELLNTCAEKLCDHVTPARHPEIKVIKDIGSAAVLCALALVGMVWIAALAERLGLF